MRNREKRRKEIRRQPFKTSSFFFFLSSSFVFIIHNLLALTIQWRVTGQEYQCFNNKFFLALKRVLKEHRNVGVLFFMQMVVGNKDKRRQKKEKEGRSFGRLPSFFFPPFFFVSHNTGLHGFVMEQLRYISDVIFGVETESRLRISPSHQVFE